MITLEVDTSRLNYRLNKFIKQSGISARTVIKKTGADLLRNILRPEPYGRHPVWASTLDVLGLAGTYQCRV